MGLGQAAFSAVYRLAGCADCLANVRESERGHLYGLMQHVLPCGQELQLHIQREGSLLVNKNLLHTPGPKEGWIWSSLLSRRSSRFRRCCLFPSSSSLTPNPMLHMQLCSLKALQLFLTLLLSDISPSFQNGVN